MLVGDSDEHHRSKRVNILMRRVATWRSANLWDPTTEGGGLLRETPTRWDLRVYGASLIKPAPMVVGAPIPS